MLFLKKKLLVLFLVINVFIFVGVSSKIENNNYATQSNEIDEYIDLEELNTDDLVDLIVDKELNYIKLFSSTELGIEKFKVNNKYYIELSTRLDATECLENMIDRSMNNNEICLLLNMLEGNYHYNETMQGNRDYIYAPNGTVIDYATYGDNSILPSQYDSLHSDVVEDFPSLVNSCISPANDAYNCHSYAWYMQDASSNHYWIAYPTSYLNDDSYYEVNNVQYGDILCYYAYGYHPINGMFVNGLYISHSAIIVGENNFNIYDNSTLSNVDLISKWGSYGVYEHNGDECPYGNLDNQFQYVKAYRPKTNVTFYLYANNNSINRNFDADGESNDISDKYEMYKLNVNFSQSYQFIVSSIYPVNVRLYDCHMQAIINNPTNTYSNGKFSVVINPTLTIGKYYLRVCYQDLSNSETINTHMHNYTYAWVSYIQHRKSCDCGVTGLQAHVIPSEAYGSGQIYATCLLCGGNALVNNYNKSQNIYPSTINGSFMLPNGVIVIVEEDIEAYIEGTLVFNYPTSQTMNNSIGSIFRQKCIY